MRPSSFRSRSADLSGSPLEHLLKRRDPLLDPHPRRCPHLRLLGPAESAQLLSERLGLLLRQHQGLGERLAPGNRQNVSTPSCPRRPPACKVAARPRRPPLEPLAAPVRARRDSARRLKFLRIPLGAGRGAHEGQGQKSRCQASHTRPPFVREAQPTPAAWQAEPPGPSGLYSSRGAPPPWPDACVATVTRLSTLARGNALLLSARGAPASGGQRKV
jgi:hypothetical protein